MIIADVQYEPLLGQFRSAHPEVPILVDTDAGDDEGPFNRAISEGRQIDRAQGSLGWAALEAQTPDEDGMLALSYTSGTTSRPKGVVYTHRSAYLAAMGNVVESQLNQSPQRCGYLWVLPMFHAMGPLFIYMPLGSPLKAWIRNKLTMKTRMDIPMGYYRREGNALLPPQDRLPSALAHAAYGANHAFLRSADGQYTPVPL